MPAPSTQTSHTEIALTFSPSDLSQLEAIATLHGTTVAAFIQKAALEAAHITTAKKSAKTKISDPSALWLTDGFESAPEENEKGDTSDLFAPVDDSELPQPAAPAPKRGVAGEQSQLAKGHGLVWEIRQALGRERMHGLGWTREQLAFVLKLSVVGVRKMEHLGTTPIKSLESRKALLGMAKLIEDPGAEIAAYIEREETALG
jgi:uncharacterized protein (DUF1778 family)